MTDAWKEAIEQAEWEQRYRDGPDGPPIRDEFDPPQSPITRELERIRRVRKFLYED